jgi:hypothetical protein
LATRFRATRSDAQNELEVFALRLATRFRATRSDAQNELEVFALRLATELEVTPLGQLLDSARRPEARKARQG